MHGDRLTRIERTRLMRVLASDVAAAEDKAGEGLVAATFLYGINCVAGTTKWWTLKTPY